VKDTVVWMKYDKMKSGVLRPGDSVVDDVIIYSLQNKKYSLKEIINPEKVTLIVAGSFT
jgi:hypothetical protein